MKIIPQKRIRDIPALLFSLISWRALPAKVVALFFGRSGETFATGMVVVLCVLIYLVHFFVNLHGKLPQGRGIFVPITGLIILGGSVLINPNEWNTLYLTYYVRYVFFALMFLLSVKDYNYLIDLYSRFALVAFILLGWQPFLSESVFVANRMDYGFTLALPCSIGIYVLAKEKKHILYRIFFVASLFMAIAFANRSTWLCIVFFIALYELVIEKNTKKRLSFILFAFFFMVVVAFFLEPILNWFIAFDNKYNYNSLGLQKIQQWLDGATLDKFTSGRQGLSQLAIGEIKSHLPFGTGVGWFETHIGIYSHNIFLDMLLYWGVFGALIIIYLSLGLVLSLVKERNLIVKTLKIMLLCMWFPKLFLSGSFTYELAFWASITLMAANTTNYAERTTLDCEIVKEI